MASPLVPLVARHLEAENAHDVAATLATFTPRCEYRVPALGVELHGLSAVQAHYESLFQSFPDFRNQTWELFDADGTVFADVLTVRRHDRVWRGLAPTGRLIRSRSLARFWLAPDGLLGGEIVHADPLDVLRQMGALPVDDVVELAARARSASG